MSCKSSYARVRNQNLVWDFPDRDVRDTLFCFVLEWSIQLPFVSLSSPRTPLHHTPPPLRSPPRICTHVCAMAWSVQPDSEHSTAQRSSSGTRILHVIVVFRGDLWFLFVSTLLGLACGVGATGYITISFVLFPVCRLQRLTSEPTPCLLMDTASIFDILGPLVTLVCFICDHGRRRCQLEDQCEC